MAIAINSTLEQQATSQFADEQESEWRIFEDQLTGSSEAKNRNQSGGVGGGYDMMAEEKSTISSRKYID